MLYGRSPAEFGPPLKSFLQLIVCSNQDSGTAICGSCRDCRQAENLTHPDITAPGAPGSTGDIEVDDRFGVQLVRDRVIEPSTLTPARSPYKLFWLHDLSRFTTEASNSLLKVLEEPPGETIFLLTTRSRWDCLATIRSRCQWIRLPPEKKTFDSLVEKSRDRLTDPPEDQEQLDSWIELLKGESRSHRFNWSRTSAQQFLEFLLLLVNEHYTSATDQGLPGQSIPGERLSYRLIPDILDRLGELERGGNPQLIVNSMLEEIFYPEESTEWVSVI